MLYFRMIKIYGASRSMIVAYLIPIFGIIWGCVFLRETITPSMLIGGTVVLFGTILVTRSAREDMSNHALRIDNSYGLLAKSHFGTECSAERSTSDHPA